jgi:hypothetical protein
MPIAIALGARCPQRLAPNNTVERGESHTFDEPFLRQWRSNTHHKTLFQAWTDDRKVQLKFA